MTEDFKGPADAADGPSGNTPSDDRPIDRPPAPPRPSFKRRHWGKLLLLTIIGLPVAGFVAWVLISLNWSYSAGQRAGYVQKISRKGFICKTWEGVLYTDIARGFRADSFAFTVRSDSIAKEIEGLSGKRVSVHYEQHVYVPNSCFGDTEYFVIGVDIIPD